MSLLENRDHTASTMPLEALQDMTGVHVGELPFVYPSADPMIANTALHKSVVQLRTDFVESQGWLEFKEGESDQDRYDILPGSLTFVTGIDFDDQEARSNSQTVLDAKRVRACMRLTAVGSAKGSLSAQMWGSELLDDPDFQDAYDNHADALTQSAEAGRLFDLTRLATSYEAYPTDDSNASGSLMKNAIRDCFTLFGAGVACTDEVSRAAASAQEDTPLRWIFTINQSVRGLLDAAGVEYAVLKEGKVTPTDNYNSTLCFLDAKVGALQVRDIPGLGDVRSDFWYGFANYRTI